MSNNLINVDYFKKVYYKSLLPLEKINDFLLNFQEDEIDDITEILIKIFNVNISRSIAENFENTEDKKDFFRLCQDDYQNPKILDYLAEKFPNSRQLIVEIIERSLLAAQKSLTE